MLEKITLIRNFFYRCFFIGVAFYLFTLIVWFGAKEPLISYVNGLFEINRHDTLMLMIYFISWMKGLNLYGFLIPALALHWTGYSLKREQAKK